MFKGSPEIPFPFTKPTSELSPAFLADAEGLRGEQKMKRLQPFLVSAVEKFLVLNGLTQLRLVSWGSESLVFTSVDQQHRRKVVFKVNYRYGLIAFDESNKRIGDEATSLKEASEATRFECNRLRGTWHRLQRRFPEAVIPSYHFSTYELPISKEVLREAWELSPLHRDRNFPGSDEETRLPVIVMQQRMANLALPKEDRAELGFAAIWSRTDVQNLPAIAEEVDGVLMHGLPTEKIAERLLATLFPDIVRFQQRLIGKPEEMAQIKRLLESLDNYVQKTRTGLDLVGDNNLSFVRDTLPDGSSRWRLEFIDPFLPKITSRSPAPSIDELKELFALAKSKNRFVTYTERQRILAGIGLYYEILVLRAWGRLFKAESTIAVEGLDTVTTLEMRNLFYKAIDRLCI